MKQQKLIIYLSYVSIMPICANKGRAFGCLETYNLTPSLKEKLITIQWKFGTSSSLITNPIKTTQNQSPVKHL